MNQKSSTKSTRKKGLPWLRICIIVLGHLVIFGLGFSLGLYYSQNLYLVEDNLMQTKTILPGKNQIPIASNELTFYKELKKFNKNNLEKINKGPLSDQEPNKIEPQKEEKKEDFEFQKKILNRTFNGYTIQVYSFKSNEFAEKKVSELKEKGYPSYKSTIDLGKNGIYYRVRVGHFKNRSEAINILERILKSENKDAFITRD